MQSSKFKSAILSLDEEREIFQRFKSGDENALGLIVYHFQPLAYKIVNNAWKTRSDRFRIELDDLLQEANIAIVIAAQKFDYKKGIYFAPYARTWIHGRVAKYIIENGTIFSINASSYTNLIKQYNNAKAVLEGDEDIELDTLKLHQDTIQLVDIIKTVPVDYSTIEDVLVKDDAYIDIFNIIMFEKALKAAELTKLEAEVLYSRIFGYSSLEVGQQMGFSRETARKIELRAVEKLRNTISENQDT